MQKRNLQSSEPSTEKPLWQERQEEESEQVSVATHERSESVEALTALLSAEAKQVKPRFWRSMIAATLLTSFVFSLNFHSLIPPNVIIPLVLSSALLFSLLTALSPRSSRKQWRNILLQLVEKVDIRAIGSFIDALDLEDKQARQLAGMALTTLLPRLKASEAGLLNEKRRARLLAILSTPIENPLYKDIKALFRPAHSDTIDLHVAILKAFEQVGDSKALPIVEKLAKNAPKSKETHRIQAAAQACLPFLQQRAQQQNQKQTLLRPASATAEDGETLLRPLKETPETDAANLLRPSHREQNS